jgi:hypothetical protein
MAEIAPASDPCWSDASFRTSKFREAVASSGLTLKAISEITGRSYSTVRGWASGREYQIPTAELRALLYDLAARDRSKK